MVDLFANSLGTLSVKGTANITGDTTMTGTLTVNSAVTLNANGTVSATSYTGNGAGLTGVDPFEANTSMIFNQASAPTGWTKQTGSALANTAMSIVTGTGGGTGGSDSFYSTFASSRNADTSGASVSVSGSVGGHTLSTPEIASHNHGPFPYQAPQGQNPNSQRGWQQTTMAAKNYDPWGFNTWWPWVYPSTGGGGSHSHPFSVNSSSLGGTVSMPAMDVKYANVIVANKD